MDLAETAKLIASSYVPPDTGRPAAIQHADTVQELLTYIEDGCYPEIAAELADISLSTYQNWVRRGEAGEPPFDLFLRAVKRAAAKAEHAEILKVRKAGENPQYWTGSMTFLERRHPERWSRRTETPQDAKITIAIGLGSAQTQALIQVQTQGHLPAAPDALPDPTGT